MLIVEDDRHWWRACGCGCAQRPYIAATRAGTVDEFRILQLHVQYHRVHALLGGRASMMSSYGVHGAVSDHHRVDKGVIAVQRAH
jgi:hypothetical protein